MSRATKPAPRLSRPPEGCTCIWSNTTNHGSVYVSMGEGCSAWPHPSTWSRRTKA